MAGYHTTPIAKGTPGELSKIQEELDELKDADLQSNKILAAVELSDLVLAVQLYIELHCPGFTFEDVTKMADLTRKAFNDGSRKPRVDAGSDRVVSGEARGITLIDSDGNPFDYIAFDHREDQDTIV